MSRGIAFESFKDPPRSRAPRTFIEGGNGRAVVMIHGNAGGVEDFEFGPDLLKNFESKGVVRPDALSSSLQAYVEQSGPRQQHARLRQQSSDRAVFAAMPFDRQYDDTFLIAMSYAAERVNAACKRVDRAEFSGDIVEEIKRLINESVAVIIDLSEAKANVLYEADYSHA